MSDVEILAFPLLSNATVTGLVITTGTSLSTTVTLNEHVETPQVLVAVAITVVNPFSNTVPGLCVYAIEGAGIPLDVARAKLTAAPHKVKSLFTVISVVHETRGG